MIYRVQPGDTLTRIARRFGTSVPAIVALNGIARPDLIVVGQLIELPDSPEHRANADAGAASAVAEAAATAREGSDAWARPIVQAALRAELGREPTERETQGVQALCRSESTYARGWTGGMEGSHNWGATQVAKAADGTCPVGSRGHGDSSPDTGKYAACFGEFPDDLSGCRAAVRAMYRRKQAPNRRTPSIGQAVTAEQLAAALWGTGYFEGFGSTAGARIESKAAQLRAILAGMAQATKVPNALPSLPLLAMEVSYRRAKGKTSPARAWEPEKNLDPNWYALETPPAAPPTTVGGSGSPSAGPILAALAAALLALSAAGA